MLISAIVPTTGARPTLLSRALASIRDQAKPADEIIVVVDGTSAAAGAVTGPAVRVVVTGTRYGAAAARNAGAKLASGRFLAFLDDDDAWKPLYLSTVFATGTGFDVALSGFDKVSSGLATPEKVPPERLLPEDFLVRNPGLRGSNLVITAELFEKMAGFDATLQSLHDLDFGYRLALVKHRYRRVVERLVDFHVHDGPRLSSAGSETNRAGLARFWQIYRSRMNDSQATNFRARALKLWGVDPAATEVQR